MIFSALLRWKSDLQNSNEFFMYDNVLTDENADVYAGLMWSCDQSLIYIQRLWMFCFEVIKVYANSCSVGLAQTHPKLGVAISDTVTWYSPISCSMGLTIYKSSIILATSLLCHLATQDVAVLKIFRGLIKAFANLLKNGVNLLIHSHTDQASRGNLSCRWPTMLQTYMPILTHPSHCAQCAAPTSWTSRFTWAMLWEGISVLS